MAFWPIRRIANTLFQQDVNGLTDLNTAAPDILERVVVAFDLGPEAMVDYIAWRRSGRRLLRASDFLRVTGAGQDRLAELLAVAAVHSGRRGIAPDVAPVEVLTILGQDELPPAWLSPPSGVNYAVVLTGGERSLDRGGAYRTSGGGWAGVGSGLVRAFYK